MNWLQASWDGVRTSLWLVPGIMFIVGVALAAGVLALDRSWDRRAADLAGWIGTGDGRTRVP